MATKMKRLTLLLRTFLLLIWTTVHSGDGYSCPYGESCGFEPAPPGRAPACAQPGLTYCVHPDPYPEQIIRQLIEAGQYDIRTLLSDESRDDFNSKKNDYPYGYGPNSLPNVDQISLVNDVSSVYPKNYNTKFHTRYNHDIFSQKTPLQPPSPVDPTPYDINTYQPQNFSKFGFHGYSSPNYWNPQQYDTSSYNKKVFRPTTGASIGPNNIPNIGPNNIPNNMAVYNQNFFDTPPFYPTFNSNDWLRPAASNVGVTHYNPNEWWKYVSPHRSDVSVARSLSFPVRTTTVRQRQKRNAALVKAAAKRTLTGTEALRIALGLASAETSAELADRPRRQAGNTIELCRSRTEFITPRAAMNNRGNWRFVVNMPENMTQLVKTEVCMSTECNGICSIPTGYRSQCQQKYIQKRLVALESSGSQLYTDLFWIPSCCQCTIVSNT